MINSLFKPWIATPRLPFYSDAFAANNVMPPHSLADIVEVTKAKQRLLEANAPFRAAMISRALILAGADHAVTQRLLEIRDFKGLPENIAKLTAAEMMLHYLSEYCGTVGKGWLQPQYKYDAIGGMAAYSDKSGKLGIQPDALVLSDALFSGAPNMVVIAHDGVLSLDNMNAMPTAKLLDAIIPTHGTGIDLATHRDNKPLVNLGLGVAAFDPVAIYGRHPRAYFEKGHIQTMVQVINDSLNTMVPERSEP